MTLQSLQSLTPSPEFIFSPIIASNSTSNTSLYVSLSAHRTLSHTSTITTSSGTRTLTWSQSLSYANTQNFTAAGYNETLYQLTSGTSTFSPSSSSHATITNEYEYPISFYQSYIIPSDPTVTNSTLIATLDRSKIETSVPILPYLTSPSHFAVGEILQTRQNGSCIYFWNNTYYEFAGAIDPAKGTVGGTEQWFSFEGPVYGEGDNGREEYGRHVKALDGYEPVLILDETFAGLIDIPDTERAR